MNAVPFPSFQMFAQLKTWLDLAAVGQSRSSITNPLQWMMVILFGGLFVVYWQKFPPWVIVAFVVCILVVFVLFLYTYVWFMHKDPDVLRSENFHLSKMAIERGIVGDSLQGIVDAEKQLGGQIGALGSGNPAPSAESDKT